MKQISSISAEIRQSMQRDKEVLCDYIFTPWGPKRLESPVMSDLLSCEFCGGKGYYLPFLDPTVGPERAWLCDNIVCLTYKGSNDMGQYVGLSKSFRSILWPLFCEINGIGDANHDVKFEEVNQDPKKVDYLRRFAQTPKGIILMQGSKGVGKTYCAMATCEYYTRAHTSCVFNTHRQLLSRWMAKDTNFIDKVEKNSLVVIDDFGTGEPTPGFLSYFMDLVNIRMQWSDRGTIITTNLDDDKLALYCGEALVDRLLTGMNFVFKGESRRKKNIL